MTGSLSFSTDLTDSSAVVDLTASLVVRDDPGQPRDPDVATTCMVTARRAGPPRQQDVTVQDAGRGLASISNAQITNGSVRAPTFTVGTTAPVVVKATKTDQSKTDLLVL